MISKFKEIEGLFKEIDSKLKEEVDVFMIGGGVLLHRGLKPATKDIDLVVAKEKDFRCFSQALKECGFGPKHPTKEYLRMELNEIFVRNDFRIDLFCEKICGGFVLSGEMQKRAVKTVSLKNLRLHLCSNEDIFLFKTMTEREGDLEDCLALAKAGLDWKIILEELQSQIKTSGKGVWVTWIGERMDLLEEKGLKIPVMKELNKLRNDFFDQLERKLNK